MNMPCSEVKLVWLQLLRRQALDLERQTSARPSNLLFGSNGFSENLIEH